MCIPRQDLCPIHECCRIDDRVCDAPLFHVPPHRTSGPCNVEVHWDKAAPEPDLDYHKIHLLYICAIESLQFRDSHHRCEFAFRPLNNVTNLDVSPPVLDPRPGIENDNDLNPLRYTRILSAQEIPRNLRRGASAFL